MNPDNTTALLEMFKDVAAKAYAKDTVANRPTHGFLYMNGPFSFLENEPLSSVITGGSPLLNWIPYRLVDYRYTTGSHLEWVAPDGFDGSQTYREYLRGLDIADCDYGPTAVWSGFEYQLPGNSTWSFQSPAMKEDDFGMRDYEKSPIYAVRGDNAGRMPLQDDAAWGQARALFLMEQHMNYQIIYGDRNNSEMEFDGIDTILQPGYITSKVVGPGTPYFAQPLVMNAAGVTSAQTILTYIRSLVRKMRTRLQQRSWNVAYGDMVIVIPAGLWVYIAEAMAAGAGAPFANYGFAGQMTYRDFNAELQRIMASGAGQFNGTIDVDGDPVPVIAEPNMGVNRTITVGGQPKDAILGDIYILTKRVNGITLWEQKYVDYNKLTVPDNGTQQTFKRPLFNGLIRGGWKINNNACYQYYLKAAGRLECSFLPLQARINNVALVTLTANENENGQFWNQDFFPYGGAKGGTGSALLTPL